MDKKQQKLIDGILAKIDEFPTLPTIYNKLSDTIANPRCSAKDVAEVIAQDQASTTKVLKIANSAMYGFVSKVTSITQAVVYIGFQEVKALVLALSVIDMFKGTKDNDVINIIDLWKFSFAVGVISRSIAKTSGEKVTEDFFVAGIVHGIGKLLFLKSIPDMYYKVLLYTKENNVRLIDVERKVLGITHSQVSQILAEKWKLPKSLQNTLGNYYIGFVDGRFQMMTGVIHLAVISGSMYQFGDPCDRYIPNLNKEIWNFLKLPENFFSSNYPIFSKEYDEMVGILLG